MSGKVIVIIDGVRTSFYGDELTSAEQQAILFLQERDKEGSEF